MQPHLRPRALLLDLDGVLRIWNPSHVTRAEQRSGLPAGAIHRTAFDPELLLPAITGRVTDEAWRQLIAERLFAEHPKANAALAVSMWSETPGEIDLGVLSLVRSCHESVAIVLVTNATTRLVRDLERLGLATMFDQVINSSELGHAKPSREIFAQALASVGVTETEALFVEDDAGNVAAAAELGISGHVYQGISQLLVELARRNLLM